MSTKGRVEVMHVEKIIWERKEKKSYDRCLSVCRNEKKHEGMKENVRETIVTSTQGQQRVNRSVNTYTKQETLSSASTTAVVMMSEKKNIEKSNDKE